MHVDDKSPSKGGIAKNVSATVSCHGGIANHIKLQIVDARGEAFDLEVTPETGIEKLKLIAIGKSMAAATLPASSTECGPLVNVNPSFNPRPLGPASYKLISVDKYKTLVDEATIHDEGLKDGDSLLLLERIPLQDSSIPGASPDLLDKPLGGRDMRATAPSLQLITEMTAHLPSRNMKRRNPEMSSQLDFQHEIRKILISLVDFAEQILRNHPDVEPIFRDLNVYMGRPQTEAQEQIDQEALQQLMDMGFGREKAKRALKLNGMSAVDAMDWLLAYDSAHAPTPTGGTAPVGIPASLLSSQNPFSSAEGGQAQSMPNMDRSNTLNVSNSEQKGEIEQQVEGHIGLYPRVPAIVECYRNFKRVNFRAQAKALRGLMEMGFTESEAQDALWIHQNNEVTACEYLLSDRRPKYDDLQRGLSKDNPIYKALLQSPVIQVGLIKPKVFFSFLQLIEEPNNTGRFFSDPETSPVLSQIFRTYHSEKHVAYGSGGTDGLEMEENEGDACET